MKEIRTRCILNLKDPLSLDSTFTALTNFIFAQKNAGKFFVYIENSPHIETKYLEDLVWLGISSNAEPLRQSDRLSIYKKYTEKLLNEDKAFYCYCAEEELKKAQEEALKNWQNPHYNGRCRNLSSEEKKQFEDEGRQPVIRFKTLAKEIIHHDLIRGKITFPDFTLGDFVIVEKSGAPTYTFAACIDDALMPITHVLRSEQYFSHTCKEIMLQEILELPTPHYGHFFMLRGEDETGKIEKLSSRHGAHDLCFYKKSNYKKEAIIHYLMSLYVSLPDKNKEPFDMNYFLENFTLDHFKKNIPIFNSKKLDELNVHFCHSRESRNPGT